jgi:phosphoserine phosphatase RsbU/P
MHLTDDKKFEILLAISHKVRDTLDLDEIMDDLLDTVKTLVDYDAAGIFVLNQDLVYAPREHPIEKIAGVARRGFEERPHTEDAMLMDGKGIIGHVISTCESLIAPDVSLDPYYFEGRSQTRSEITVPIMRNKRAIGALDLESDQLNAYHESDREILELFADAASISIEKAMLHRQILEKRLLDKQIELARGVQSRLFPGEPPHIPGYDIAGVCIPAEEIGGDYYDFIKLTKGGLGVAVADVSGHGIAAALVMTAFRGLLRTHTRGRLGPAKIARSINRLLPDCAGSGDFVTAVYAILSSISEEITYVCCGQEPPLLLHSDGSLGNLNVRNPALGIIKNVSFATEKLSLASGDILAIYTDGVVELANQEGVSFGVDRLAISLHEGRDLSAEELILKIIHETQQFSGSQSYLDDFTLVVIKRI